jgi:protoporphyrin/coproporphyrin ferrochelatase
LPLAWLIAWRRGVTAGQIYARLGGASPLLANTEAQARALEGELGPEHRCFIAMRYWHPLTAAAVSAVAQWQPEEIVLLPLYPQYSTTTTASSLRVWTDEAARQGLAAPTRAVRSYPTMPGIVSAIAALVAEQLDEGAQQPVRLLFSAHGLPLKTVRAGDPYPQEVKATAGAVVRVLNRPGLDWCVCYQSKVGPLAWLGPSVEEELHRAGRDGLGVVIAPISFVSEHAETLVELDVDYRKVAENCGVPTYRRVPTVGTHPLFIEALADLVRGELAAPAAPEGSLALSGTA